MPVFFLLLFAGITSAYANGVERGSAAGIMSEELQAKIRRQVEERCDLHRALSLDVTNVQVRAETVDQREKDLYYTVTLAADIVSLNDEFTSRQSITVKAAEYALSHPDVEKRAVLSVRSKICD